MQMFADLNDATFGDFIRKNKVVLVDFYADWCGPCLVMEPVMEELSQEMKGKIAFAKIDVDQNRQRPAEYGVMSIPTLLVFRAGKLVDRLVGALPKETLKQRLGKFIE